MDECVLHEEALRAEESRKAEEQSSRRLPARHRSRWPFSFDDFGKTDEYRLPPLSTELAAFSPGPAEASPRRRRTNSSSPCISQRSDNRNDPSESADRSSKRHVETTVERLASRTETRTREERKDSYAGHSTSKHHAQRKEATPQSPTPPRAISLIDLQRLRDSESPRRRHSIPRAPRTSHNTQNNRGGRRPSGDRNTSATSDKAQGVAPETKYIQLHEIIEMIREKDNWPAKKKSQKFANRRIKFTAECRGISGEFTTDPPQHGALIMVKIATSFPVITDLSLYSIKLNFHYTTGSMAPRPRIFHRAEYALNKGDAETGRGKRLDTVTRSNAVDTSFLLELKDFKSSTVVVYVTLLLEQEAQGKITEMVRAGVGFHVVGVDQEGSPIRRMCLPGEDVELTLKPRDLERHRKPVALDDLNLHQFLRSWVESE